MVQNDVLQYDMFALSLHNFLPDINECLTKPCHVNANCSNSEGSYTCQCHLGFAGDGKTCAGNIGNSHAGFDDFGNVDCLYEKVFSLQKTINFSICLFHNFLQISTNVKPTPVMLTPTVAIVRVLILVNVTQDLQEMEQLVQVTLLIHMPGLMILVMLIVYTKKYLAFRKPLTSAFVSSIISCRYQRMSNQPLSF